MPTIIARITQGTQKRPFLVQMARGGNLPGNPYKDVAQAKLAAQNSFGARPIRWEQDVRADGVSVLTGYDSAFAPDSLSGLVEWQDANAGIGILPASANLLTSWGDLSGNGNAATQPAQIRMPTAVSAASGPNGRPSVQYNPAVVKYLLSGLAVTMNAFTVVVIAQANAPTAVATHGLVGIESLSTPLHYMVGLDATGHWCIQNGGLVLAGPLAIPNTLQQLAYVQRSTGGSLYVDGTLVGSNGLSGANISSDTAAIGLRTDLLVAWNGFISAVQIYSRALASPELTRLFAFNRAAWGTP